MKQLVILSLLFTVSYCRKKLVTFNDNADLISTSAIPTSSSMDNEIPDDSKLQRLIQKMNQPGREEEFERIASKFIEDMEQIEKDKSIKTDAKKDRNNKRMKNENSDVKERSAKKDFHFKAKAEYAKTGSAIRRIFHKETVAVTEVEVTNNTAKMELVLNRKSFAFAKSDFNWEFSIRIGQGKWYLFKRWGVFTLVITVDSVKTGGCFAYFWKYLKERLTGKQEYENMTV